MSSSTMIHGATIRRPKPQRTIADAATRLASQNQAGSERAIAIDSARTRARVVDSLTPKPDLVEQAGDLRGLLALFRDADLGGRLGHLMNYCVPNCLASDRLLQCGHVRLGRPVEVVLGGDVRARSVAHRRAGAVVRGEELERGAQRLGL